MVCFSSIDLIPCILLYFTSLAVWLHVRYVSTLLLCFLVCFTLICVICVFPSVLLVVCHYPDCVQPCLVSLLFPLYLIIWRV